MHTSDSAEGTGRRRTLEIFPESVKSCCANPFSPGPFPFLQIDPHDGHGRQKAEKVVMSCVHGSRGDQLLQL
jgi:hypothetical protein